MYLVPILGGLLALVRFAASFTVRNDMDKLHRWMLKVDRTPIPDHPASRVTRGGAGRRIRSRMRAVIEWEEIAGRSQP